MRTVVSWGGALYASSPTDLVLVAALGLSVPNADTESTLSKISVSYSGSTCKYAPNGISTESP